MTRMSPQKPEDKGDPEGPEAGWWTRERVCGAKEGPGEGAPKAWRLGTGPFAFAGGDLWPVPPDRLGFHPQEEQSKGGSGL